jgi:hypothetical protein
MEPLEEEGTMEGDIGCNGGASVGCMAVAVDMLVEVAMVSW